MKLWELDWTPGREYKDIDGNIWQVDSEGVNLVNAGDAIIAKFVSLKTLATADFEPCVDWSKVEVDTKILVRDADNETWAKRHFAGFENNKILTFWTGCTSWTHPYGRPLTDWKYAKLAESED